MMTLVDTFRQKSLRQGDPLSVMLFNIVADILAILIERAKVDGQTKGVVPRRCHTPFYGLWPGKSEKPEIDTISVRAFVRS
jgi:hypothetical protein